MDKDEYCCPAVEGEQGMGGDLVRKLVGRDGEKDHRGRWHRTDSIAALATPQAHAHTPGYGGDPSTLCLT